MLRQQGVTLLESLVTLVIFYAIFVFAQYSMSTWIKKQQANLIYIELRNAVLSARSYAVYNRRPLTFCGSGEGKTCDNQWAIGALLFEDLNRNATIDNTDHIISYRPFNLKKATLIWKGFNGQHITFENMGITSASNGTFTYCQLDKDASYSRQIIVSRGGRPRLSQDKNGDGFHEDSKGKIITCPN